MELEHQHQEELDCYQAELEHEQAEFEEQQAFRSMKSTNHNACAESYSGTILEELEKRVNNLERNKINLNRPLSTPQLMPPRNEEYVVALSVKAPKLL